MNMNIHKTYLQSTHSQLGVVGIIEIKIKHRLQSFLSSRHLKKYQRNPT